MAGTITDKGRYTFMELAAGGDLFSMLHRVEYITENDVRSILRQIVRGVHHLHKNGVAHRDIKLENILLATCPKASHRVVLADFGSSAISRRVKRMRTREIGTDIYWAPYDVPYPSLPEILG
jgi:serine/threonine protein kinase